MTEAEVLESLEGLKSAPYFSGSSDKKRINERKVTRKNAMIGYTDVAILAGRRPRKGTVHSKEKNDETNTPKVNKALLLSKDPGWPESKKKNKKERR